MKYFCIYITIAGDTKRGTLGHDHSIVDTVGGASHTDNTDMYMPWWSGTKEAEGKHRMLCQGSGIAMEKTGRKSDDERMLIVWITTTRREVGIERECL